MFSWKLKNSRRYHSSKNKKIRDRVDSRVQLILKLRVKGSWSMLKTFIYESHSYIIHSLDEFSRLNFKVALVLAITILSTLAK